MSAGGKEYTLFFAYVPPDTPWDVSLARFDEIIFDLVIEHVEGQIPTAIVEIKNPRIGLLNPSRLFWIWISFSYEACGPLPLFFGRLVGIPDQLAQNTIRMKFVTRDTDYIYQKQQMARLLKVPPNYDPIFFETAKRDDPDAILEGWSALYHVGRIDGRVSASDIVIGEDGTVTFAAQDVFYDNFEFKILQSPLVAVNIKADVQWEQQYRGAFYVGQWAWPTLGSDAFVGDWPKSGSNLGGGWYAGVSWAGQRDPSILQDFQFQQQQSTQFQQIPLTFKWVNQEKKHETGDTMSVSINYTPPFGTQILLKTINQPGFLDPQAVDENGDPAPINTPSFLSMDWFCYYKFALNFQSKQSLASLGLVYEANRKRFEKLEMTVTADVQPVLIDPLVVEDTEQITLKSGDLSLPLIDYQNWDSVGMGGSVTAGQFIFPDNPLVPGQTSSQIALNSGTTGMVQPVFSNIAGQTTSDGSVTWVSLGDTPPAEGTQDWAKFLRIPLGTLLLPKPVSGVPDINSTKIPGSLNYPPTGTAVPRYSIFCEGFGGPGDAMFECSAAGLLGGLGPQASFSTFTNPSGQFLYIAIAAGTTGEFHSTFPESPGAQHMDGSVTWQCIGPVELPIGGSPGMTPRAAYFPTDRGQISVQHMLCRARAKLRKRARAAQLSFDTRFEVAAQLSCRMNGKVSDVRIPGGVAFGKVISYKLEAHGDTGVLKGSVVLGCTIGNASIGVVALDAPRLLTASDIPSWVEDGWVERGWQQYYSGESGAGPVPPIIYPPFPPPPYPPRWPHVPPEIPPESCPPLDSAWLPGPPDITGNQIGYTPPVSDPNDDGIVFPASPSDLILQQKWHGIASTLSPENLEIYNLQLDQIIHDAIEQAKAAADPNQTIGTPGTSKLEIPAINWFDYNIAVQIAVLKDLMQGQGLWFELVLKPLTNGPFSNYYVVSTTPLPIARTVNLQG